MGNDPDTPQNETSEMSRDEQIVFWILIFVVLFSTLN